MFNTEKMEKGEKFALEKETDLTKVKIGMGWDEGKFDLDVSVFGLGSNKKIVNNHYFIFYNQPQTPTGSIQHSGDNKSGEGDGDDEQIMFDLDLCRNEGVQELAIIITMHKAVENRQNFGQVKNAYCRVYDDKDNVLKQYDLSEDFSAAYAVHVGSLYLHDGFWKFHAVGEGFKATLNQFIEQFT